MTMYSKPLGNSRDFNIYIYGTHRNILWKPKQPVSQSMRIVYVYVSVLFSLLLT